MGITGGASRIASSCGPGGRGRGKGLPRASPAPAPGVQGGGRGGCAASTGAAPPLTGGGAPRPRPPPLLPRLLAPGPARAPSRARPAQAPRPASAVTRPRARCGQRPERLEEPGLAAAAAAAARGKRGGCGSGSWGSGLRPPPANRRRRAVRAALGVGKRGSARRGGGGGRSPRPARRLPARPALLRRAFSAPAAPRSGSLGHRRGCCELPRARPGPRLRDGKLAPLGSLRQRRPPLLLLTAPSLDRPPCPSLLTRPPQLLTQTVPPSPSRVSISARISAPRLGAVSPVSAPSPLPSSRITLGSASLAPSVHLWQESVHHTTPLLPPLAYNQGPDAPSRSPGGRHDLGVVGCRVGCHSRSQLGPRARPQKVLGAAAGAERATGLVPAGGGVPGPGDAACLPASPAASRAPGRTLAPPARGPPLLLPWATPGFRSQEQQRWLQDWHWEVPREMRLVGEAPSCYLCPDTPCCQAASQPPACQGSPDIGEQKLSVPVATEAPAAAKFRGGRRRVAESPPPPPPPARHRPRGLGAARSAPTPALPAFTPCGLGEAPGGPLLRQTPRRETERPSLPVRGEQAAGEGWFAPLLSPAHQLRRPRGGCAPSRIPELQERGPLRTPPPAGCAGRNPEASSGGRPCPCSGLGPDGERSPGRQRVSDGQANWSCQVDKRDGGARRRGPRPLTASPPPAARLPAAPDPAHRILADWARSLGSRRPGPCPEAPLPDALGPP
ncbi:translation initiation factor IF-2-like [Elephas maximus indicus]|uniref:translation initiation factor IF-2-like n=1 Tax=Elephas maximus indicus TaxID=99487 RepID=UPI0021166B58|nr:translation initiation factor IF-2-like [Elephas maximus indicus]